MAWADFLGLAVVDVHINGDADSIVLDTGNVAFRRLHIPAHRVQGSKPTKIGIGALRHLPADRGIPVIFVFTEQRDKLFGRGKVKYCFHFQASRLLRAAKNVNRGGTWSFSVIPAKAGIQT